jgi:hypothetical protein
MKLKFKLNETVQAIKSGKSGVVEAVYVDAKGVHFDVRCGEAKGRAHRYTADQLETESAAKKRKSAAEKLAKLKAKPAKAAKKPAKAVKASKPVKAAKKPAKPASKK